MQIRLASAIFAGQLGSQRSSNFGHSVYVYSQVTPVRDVVRGEPMICWMHAAFITSGYAPDDSIAELDCEIYLDNELVAAKSFGATEFLWWIHPNGTHIGEDCSYERPFRIEFEPERGGLYEVRFSVRMQSSDRFINVEQPCRFLVALLDKPFRTLTPWKYSLLKIFGRHLIKPERTAQPSGGEVSVVLPAEKKPTPPRESIVLCSAGLYTDFRQEQFCLDGRGGLVLIDVMNNRNGGVENPDELLQQVSVSIAVPAQFANVRLAESKLTAIQDGSSIGSLENDYPRRTLPSDEDMAAYSWGNWVLLKNPAEGRIEYHLSIRFEGQTEWIDIGRVLESLLTLNNHRQVVRERHFPGRLGWLRQRFSMLRGLLTR